MGVHLPRTATTRGVVVVVGGGTNAETQPTCAGGQLGIGLVPGTAY